MNKKSEVFFNRRTWLNDEDSHFTGSLVCFDGVVSNQGKPAEEYTFIELRDCHGRVRLHVDKNAENQLEVFREKLLLMQEEIDLFIDHLNSKLAEQEQEREKEVKLPEPQQSFFANFFLGK